MEFSGIETIVEDDNGDEGWVETSHQLQDNADGNIEAELNDKVCEMTLDSNKLDDLINENERGQSSDADDENEEAIDMEEFEESGLLDQVDPVSRIFTIKSASITEIFEILVDGHHSSS